MHNAHKWSSSRSSAKARVISPGEHSNHGVVQTQVGAPEVCHPGEDGDDAAEAQEIVKAQEKEAQFEAQLMHQFGGLPLGGARDLS